MKVNIDIDLKILRMLQNDTFLRIGLEKNTIEFSYNNIIFHDWYLLRQSVQKELRYKLRCRHNQ